MSATVFLVGVLTTADTFVRREVAGANITMVSSVAVVDGANGQRGI